MEEGRKNGIRERKKKAKGRERGKKEEGKDSVNINSFFFTPRFTLRRSATIKRVYGL